MVMVPSGQDGSFRNQGLGVKKLSCKTLCCCKTKDKSQQSQAASSAHGAAGADSGKSFHRKCAALVEFPLAADADCSIAIEDCHILDILDLDELSSLKLQVSTEEHGLQEQLIKVQCRKRVLLQH